MRENDCPVITDVVVELHPSLSAFCFEVGDCVSDCQPWHFQGEIELLKTLCLQSLFPFLVGTWSLGDYKAFTDLSHEENVAGLLPWQFASRLLETDELERLH